MKIIESLALGFLGLVLAMPATADQRYDGHTPAERLNVKLGGYHITGMSSTIRIDSKQLGIGAIVDLEENLKVEKSLTIGRLDGFYRFNDHHRIEWAYYQFKRTGMAEIINESITIGDEVFEIGDVVASEWKMGVAKLGWAYSFINLAKYEFFLGAGLNFRELSLKFENTLISGGMPEVERFEADGLLPMPTVTAGMRWNFTDKLSMNMRYEVFGIDVGTVDGRMQDAYLTLEHNTFKHIGFGGGISQYNFDLGVDDGKLRGEVESSYTGILLFLKGYF